MIRKRFFVFFLACFWIFSISCLESAAQKKEEYRPHFHFSPLKHWMNDPNGLIFYKGTYHLFFQYYPKASVWGPMHWGHATSTDLFHWKELPIALYPDNLGYIFSGSAVFDSLNTSGFGLKNSSPLVAIFTQHDAIGEKKGSNTYQNQSLAYSTNNGSSWEKYKQNPVLKNPGITDFRDPKVFWYDAQKKWIMTLATKSSITFYSSANLKSWKKESEFGHKIGAHGGVWECPDLIDLKLDGKIYWVLIVNLNPGGPNIGSGTQYFIGSFNGKEFIPNDSLTRWLDYGPDEYAGVTWSNTGERKIFLGWMSNWLYSEKVPTRSWRNAMTIPRELSLKSVAGQILLKSIPVREIENIERKGKTYSNLVVDKEYKLSNDIKLSDGTYVLHLSMNEIKSYSIILSNSLGERLIFGFDSKKNSYYIDRTKSGVVSFHKDFPGVYFASRLAVEKQHDLTLVADVSSIEVFADSGLSVMSCVMFPKQPMDHLSLQTDEKVILNDVSINSLMEI